MKRFNLTERVGWKALDLHFEEIKNVQMKELFKNDKTRFEKFSIKFKEILFDYSKNRINKKTITLFMNLLEEINLKAEIEKMFTGEKINKTENRAVLHTALRNSKTQVLNFENENILIKIRKELDKIKKFTENIHSGRWKGYTGKKITDIVNIGIGGSHLGPDMVCEALKPYWKDDVKVHFVSNVDGTDISEILRMINPETTLFLVASKSFTTQETMTNAHSARKWFLETAEKEEYIKKHFAAISTNQKGVEEFGIDKKNMFIFWNWVGGRYSLWSAIGLSIACAIGFENFKDLLLGAEEMDIHFREKEFSVNIPVIMAVLGVWYNNFFKTESQAILAYDQYLSKLAPYLQQADMESNGKGVDRAGNKVNYQTGPIIWGQPGTNGQHAFYQLIHQGTKIIPADFIAPINTHNKIGNHHNILMSNFFAQTEALMNGKTEAEVAAEFKEKGISENEYDKILPFKVFTGNRPTNSILIKKITPRNLGSLIAMYEHKIFVQGIIWNLFSYDQWGVELGKKLAKNILSELNESEISKKHDSSTENLMREYFNNKKSQKI